MSVLFQIILACFIISLGALVGALTVAVNQDKLHRFLLLLVSLSAGALMGGAFFHLLPEAAETLGIHPALNLTLVSFIAFFLIEKILHWRHCHKHACDTHSFGVLNLIGDALHNFIDGLIIAGAFAVDFHLGWITTLAVALHEIPQEIGDFGVLLYAGYRRRQALLLDFMVALTVVLGGLAGYSLSVYLHDLVPYLIPLAAGGFLYISASDLMPEIRKEANLKKSLLAFGIFVAGILLMLFASGHSHTH